MGSSGVTGISSSQQRVVDEAGVLQALVGLLGCVEVGDGFGVVQRPGVVLLPGDVAGHGVHPGDVRTAAALRFEPTARHQRGEHASEERVVVFDPVERRRREHRVDRVDAHAERRQVEFEQVDLAHDGFGIGERGRSGAHHVGIRVDGDHPAEWDRGQDVPRHPSTTAAGVEYRFIAAQRQPFEHGQRHRLHGRRQAVIRVAVPRPTTCRTHSESLRNGPRREAHPTSTAIARGS